MQIGYMRVSTDTDRQNTHLQKDALLKEHAHILNNFNPKAASQYGTGF